MSKKKSKTQKYKKNLKRKQSKAVENVSISKNNIIEISKEKKKKLKETFSEDSKDNKEFPHSKIVEKNKIDYNVLITYENKEKIRKEKEKNNSDLEKAKQRIKEDIKSEIKEEFKESMTGITSPTKIVEEENLIDVTSPFLTINKGNKKKKSYFELVISRIKQNIKEYKLKRKNNIHKTVRNNSTVRNNNSNVTRKNKIDFKNIISLNKINKKMPNVTNIKDNNTDNDKVVINNKFIRLLFSIYNNSNIIFNTLGIVLFIIMIVGLNRIKVFETSTILYIGIIVGFLLFVAISFNKYISGKIFTSILSVGMIICIWHMQYTYDFFRNLNTGLYEYKTYYVVTFDNGLNKSIYNINNKKIGLLKDNCTNIERKLNTKIEPVYVEYEDMNKLFDDFYNQNYRAILVNENQYKYLKNNIQNNRSVKILYEFIANAKK